jgi:hypothetical protein
MTLRPTTKNWRALNDSGSRLVLPGDQRVLVINCNNQLSVHAYSFEGRLKFRYVDVMTMALLGVKGKNVQFAFVIINYQTCVFI